MPLTEKSYAEDCSFGEMWDKILDPFVLSHLFGWSVLSLLCFVERRGTLVSCPNVGAGW